MSRYLTAAANCGGAEFVSDNDVVVVFVWMLMRRLRQGGY
jgi:hypothetical protein